MDPEQQEEWHRFRHAAEQVLRGEGRDTPIVRFLVLPAATACRSHEIVRQGGRRKPPRYLAVEMTWRLEDDIAKFRSPVERLKHPHGLSPTIECREGVLQPHWVQPLIDEFKSLRLPIVPDHFRFGVDGVTYELRVGERFGGAILRWWMEPPAGWEILTSICRKVEALVRRAVEPAT